MFSSMFSSFSIIKLLPLKMAPSFIDKIVVVKSPITLDLFNNSIQSVAVMFPSTIPSITT